MIHYVSGDILLSRAQAVAHGVAPKDPMNQGLARSLHEKCPAMHKDYHHWCNQMHPKPGEAWMWGGPGGVRVINLITQEGGYGHGSHPGRATLKHVRDALRALAHIVEREGLRSLALPRLATGVGGLTSVPSSRSASARSRSRYTSIPSSTPASRPTSPAPELPARIVRGRARYCFPPSSSFATSGSRSQLKSPGIPVTG